MFGVLGVFGKLAKWGLVVGTAVVLVVLHSEGIVSVLILLVVVQSSRLARSKATSMVLAEQLVELEGTDVGEAAADALVRAGYEIGARDTAFEIMREQAETPGQVRADRIR